MTPRSPSTASLSTMRATASRMTLNVPIRLTVTTRANCSSGSTPSRPSTRPGVPMPAQLTTIRNGPADAAASTACCTDTSSVTSTATNVPPISFARSAPGEWGRSAITTWAPAAASSVAVATPRPLAPPVTIALLPSICIWFRSLLCRLFHDGEHGARLDLLPGLHPHLGHAAGRRRVHAVLHLHRLEHDHRLPRGDGVAGSDEHAHDQPRHRGRQRAGGQGGTRVRE